MLTEFAPEFFWIFDFLGYVMYFMLSCAISPPNYSLFLGAYQRFKNAEIFELLNCNFYVEDSTLGSVLVSSAKNLGATNNLYGTSV